MPGPAPKDAAARANRIPKARGEWVDLAPLDKTYLPDLKQPGKYKPRTRDLWAGLQADPVTQTFGPCEFAQCVVLAELHELAVSENTASCWAEVRQWMDRLGFTLKGKRDLRFRITEVKQERPAIAAVSTPDFKRR